MPKEIKEETSALIKILEDAINMKGQEFYY